MKIGEVRVAEDSDFALLKVFILFIVVIFVIIILSIIAIIVIIILSIIVIVTALLVSLKLMLIQVAIDKNHHVSGFGSLQCIAMYPFIEN